MFFDQYRMRCVFTSTVMWNRASSLNKALRKLGIGIQCLWTTIDTFTWTDYDRLYCNAAIRSCNFSWKCNNSSYFWFARFGKMLNEAPPLSLRVDFCGLAIIFTSTVSLISLDTERQTDRGLASINIHFLTIITTALKVTRISFGMNYIKIVRPLPTWSVFVSTYKN